MATTKSVKSAQSYALSLMSQNKSVKDRAEAYVISVKRDIQKKVIDTLVEQKEKLADELFELTNFTLETNHNAGIQSMTKEVCENRFKRIIDVEFELTLIDRELEIKQASFDKYFV